MVKTAGALIGVLAFFFVFLEGCAAEPEAYTAADPKTAAMRLFYSIAVGENSFGDFCEGFSQTQFDEKDGHYSARDLNNALAEAYGEDWYHNLRFGSPVYEPYRTRAQTGEVYDMPVSLLEQPFATLHFRRTPKDTYLLMECHSVRDIAATLDVRQQLADVSGAASCAQASGGA